MDETYITFEAFGALGNGVHDDLPAICKAYREANTKGLPVRARSGVIKCVGNRALTCNIDTETFCNLLINLRMNYGYFRDGDLRWAPANTGASVIGASNDAGHIISASPA